MPTETSKTKRVNKEVKKLYESGQLLEMDYEWITKLSTKYQLAAAMKCMRNFNLKPQGMDRPRSCLESPRTIKD